MTPEERVEALVRVEPSAAAGLYGVSIGTNTWFAVEATNSEAVCIDRCKNMRREIADEIRLAEQQAERRMVLRVAEYVDMMIERFIGDTKSVATARIANALRDRARVEVREFMLAVKSPPVASQ